MSNQRPTNIIFPFLMYKSQSNFSKAKFVPFAKTNTKLLQKRQFWSHNIHLRRQTSIVQHFAPHNKQFIEKNFVREKCFISEN